MDEARLRSDLNHWCEEWNKYHTHLDQALTTLKVRVEDCEYLQDRDYDRYAVTKQEIKHLKAKMDQVTVTINVLIEAQTQLITILNRTVEEVKKQGGFQETPKTV